MTIYQSNHAKGISDVPYPAVAGMAVSYRASISVPTGVQANDILELAVKPAGTRLIDVVFDADDLDSDGSPAIVVDAGFMSGEVGDAVSARTCGNELLAASTLGQAGGVARPTKKEAYRDSVSASAVSIGVKVTTVAATAQAGTIGATITVAAV